MGIKDSCSIESAEAFLDAVPALPVYVGNDGEALNVLKKGMSGITGACNPCPELVLALHSAHARCVRGMPSPLSPCSPFATPFVQLHRLCRDAVHPTVVSPCALRVTVK